MKILVSNDDGYLAPGLQALVDALRPLGDLTVVAPETNRSGASNSLTLDRPLTIQQAVNGFFYVNGTPSDCVHLALSGFLDFVPDLVVSGINDGANMGDDTLYSGTVAAATEGFLLGIPSLAFSLSQKGYNHFDVAARVSYDLVKRFLEADFKYDKGETVLLNVNIPAVSYDRIQGLQTTRLGKRHRAEPALRSTDPYQRTIYWIGRAGAAADDGPGTDFHATRHAYVSVTPLQIDVTHYAKISAIKEWLGA